MTELTAQCVPPQKSIAPLFLTLTFLLPLVSAIILYTYRDKITIPYNSQGLLLKSPIKIDELKIKNMNGTELTSSNLKGKWHLLYIRHTTCKQECIANWKKLQNLRIALGKDQTKLELHPVLFDKKSTTLHLNHILAVDPNGVIILDYSPSIPYKGILTDLRKLLRLSNVK